MKPTIIFNNDNIIILGHFSDIIKCAKMDLLCKIHNAILGNGYALIKYNKDFLQQLLLIDSQLSFACDSGGCSTSCGDNCSGCGGSCSKGCSQACGDCGSNCGDGCKGSCSGGCSGCGSGCADSCSGSCDGKCKGCSGCSGCSGCGSGCANTCTGCSGTCTGGCGTSCGPCMGTCTGQCGTGCDLGCDNGCTASEIQSVYNELNSLYTNIPLNRIIYALDMSNLEYLVTNESIRRNINPTNNGLENIGDLIITDSINKVLADLNNMGSSFEDKDEGDLTSASEMKTYIQAALTLYSSLVNIGRPN